MIHNLIRNALDAMHDSSSPTLEIKTRIKDSNAELVITDNGCGIPDKVLPNIFDPFFTTKPADDGSGRPSGTGLGLHICKQILETYGGEIGVKSKVETGTRMIVKLPLAEIAVAV